MSEYTEMTQAEQIALLEEFALDVLEQYSISGSDFECVNHAYNTTFKFKGSDGVTYAMRISTMSRKWPEHIWAEVQWLAELHREGTIIAPLPIANLNGEYFTNHYWFYQMGNLDIVIYPWIEGEVVEEEPTDEQLFELGRQMATMHLLSKNWKPEGYANFLAIDKPLMVREDNIFTFELDEISSEQYAIFREVNSRAEALFARLREASEPQLIHADLHFGNIIWSDGKMIILDFDDAGMGHPIQDLAISTFYLREDREREKQLFAGYASVTPLPEFDPADFELLVASRNLALLNYLIGSATADDISMIPGYIAKTERRLKHYLETGLFALLD
jgi:Ser/Thr protein kinase RdoA (MazF antagonist)